jgi:hypothetical protein
MSEATPIILCGKRAEIATAVKELLLPEYKGNPPASSKFMNFILQTNIA